MAESDRREWTKPELIVIARGGAEEAVLRGCKYTTQPTGYAGAQSSCRVAGGPPCPICQAQRAS
jgi:hypothetical protein